jgi:hypothetical protein|tara:strand:+ start:715 stop:981 length:267 start_codon:yes stop_codon:yes gene_type:complete
MQDLSIRKALIEQEENLKDFITNHFESSTEQVQDPWLKTKDVCALLSCSPATVGRRRADGTLKYSLVQKTYYHRQSDVDLMMENGRVN